MCAALAFFFLLPLCLFSFLSPSCRTIPFPTKRATFSEVKRVQETLSRVELFPSPHEAAAPVLLGLNQPRARKSAKV